MAILIDWDNIFISLKKYTLNGSLMPKIEPLIGYCEKEIGKIAISRAYSGSIRHINIFWRFGVKCIYTHVYKRNDQSISEGKSLADMELACDAMELAFTHSWIDTFVLVTGDKDFIPLIRHLRALGKKVIVIGPIPLGEDSPTSADIVREADTYFWYSTILEDFET